MDRKPFLLTSTVLLWLLCVTCSRQRTSRALIDLGIFAIITTYHHKQKLLNFVTSKWFPFGVSALSCSLWMYAAYALCNWRALHYPEDNKARLKPVFYNCKTVHRRFIPTRHSFQYSYLLVGFGISWEGNQGFLFSVNQNTCGKVPPWCLFSVNSLDFLRRGEGSLWEKLRELLLDNDEDIQEYPTIYFVTAPRFLGCSFSQVDFWYLYDRQMNLKFVVVEVMNTFDERHAYLLRPAEADAASSIHFIQVTPKRLHVSPFNDRSGRYKIISHDPLSAVSRSSLACGIDVTVILQSYDETKGRYVTKFMADIRSITPPLPAEIISLSLRSTLTFAARYGLVVLLDFPCILYQSSILWVVKKMRVYDKPEVLGDSVCRTSTELERKLEASFWKFLSIQVQYCPSPVSVSYISAASQGSEPMILTSDISKQQKNFTERQLKIKILNPGFYIQWACMCRHPKYWLHSQLSEPDLLKRVIQISQRGAGFAEETFAQILNADTTQVWIYRRKSNSYAMLHWLLELLWSAYENKRLGIVTGDLGIVDSQWCSGSYMHSGFDVSPLDIMKALLTELVAFGNESTLNMYSTLVRLAVYVGFYFFTLPVAGSA